ncbi:hypothetical protein B1B05_09070 [Domibacillus enclensis]|uniref:Uncharacterized protein n=1 Tax=Domibacillus enclensis TaxID=1017273 RepID=A0ABX4EA96_9BACI|nr:hypothetical protein B1B05_09070 [Domibacillus enclensis]
MSAFFIFIKLSFFKSVTEYWISQNEDGYYLTRSKDSMTQDFETSEALFENGTIDGKHLSVIYPDIDW